MEKLMNNKQERHGGIDLFRVISMFMVVLLHINGIGGIIKNTTPLSPLWFLSSLINVVCIIAVNCFGLISGYVNVGKKTKIKSILSLWFQAFFISVVCYALEVILNITPFSSQALIKNMLIVTFSRWWYFTAYFVLFLLMPLLNIAIEKLNKVFMAVLLVAVGVVFCVMEYLSPNLGVHGGYGFLWLSYLYCVGAYIKKYGVCIKIKGNPVKAWVYFVCYLLTVVLHFASSILYSYLKNWTLLPINYEYNFVLNVFSAIFLLLFFANVKIKSTKFLTTLSATTFGVYLIHCVWPGSIIGRFTALLNFHWAITLLLEVAFAMALFIFCAILDYLRMWLFKLIKIPVLCQKIDNGVNNVYKKLSNKFDKPAIDGAAQTESETVNGENTNTEIQGSENQPKE